MDDKIRAAVEKHYTKRDCSKECVEISIMRKEIRGVDALIKNRAKWIIIVLSFVAIIGLVIIWKENGHDTLGSKQSAEIAAITKRLDIQRNDIDRLEDKMSKHVEGHHGAGK